MGKPYRRMDTEPYRSAHGRPWNLIGTSVEPYPTSPYGNRAVLLFHDAAPSPYSMESLGTMRVVAWLGMLARGNFFRVRFGKMGE